MSINNIQISLPQNEDIQHNAIKNRSVYLNICLHPFKYSHLRQDQTRTTLGKLLECMLMKANNSFYSGNKFFFIKIKKKGMSFKIRKLPEVRTISSMYVTWLYLV